MFSNIEGIVDKDLVVQEVHMESSMVTTSIWRKIIKWRNGKEIEYMCAYWCEEIIYHEQWWTQGIGNGSLLSHMDGICN